MVRVALAQMRSGRTVMENVEAVERFAEEAAGAGAAYLQTPEMTTLLERSRTALIEKIAPEAEAEAIARLRDAARRNRLTLHVGSLPFALDAGKVANRAFVIGPDGAVLATYDKIHLFDVDLDNGESWRESATYQGGERAVMVETEAFSLGLSVCYDLRFAALYRALAQGGAQVLAVPAAFTRQTGEAHWHVLLRARAIETGSFVLAAAQGGRHEDGRETYGHSLIVDPWGRVLAEKTDAEPGLLIADLELSRVAEARQRIPALQHDRVFTLDRIARPARLDGA